MSSQPGARQVFDPKRYNTWCVGLLAAQTFCIAGMVDRETSGDLPGMFAGSYALIAVSGLDRRPTGEVWVRN